MRCSPCPGTRLSLLPWAAFCVSSFGHVCYASSLSFLRFSPPALARFFPSSFLPNPPAKLSGPPCDAELCRVTDPCSPSLGARAFAVCSARVAYPVIIPIPQDQLRKLWHTAAPGRLTPWQQARALALRDVSRDEYGGHVCVSWIAAKLRKTDVTGEA